ncbi:MAG: hypothetical protein V3W14_00335, partial [Candidatus Neomarinimicrobiota bacterium]
DPDAIPHHALFHLHGQRSGFVILNTEREVKKLAASLGPVIQDSARERTWIVVGYSGDNDPVFQELAKIERFRYRLFWIGHQKDEPATHVRKHLLSDERFAFHIKDWDADRFFIKLGQKLGCFPPTFVDKPFSHLNHSMADIMPFPVSKELGEGDITQESGKWIKEAIQRYEEGKKVRSAPKKADLSRKIQEAQKLYMGGAYDQVWNMRSEFGEKPPPEMIDVLAGAALFDGRAHLDQAETKTGTEAGKLFTESYKRFAAALEFKPDTYAAFSNWGYALLVQANSSAGKNVSDLHTQAKKKLVSAEDILPGSGAYNLACLNVRLGNKEECLHWLEVSRKHGKLPPLGHIQKDKDFDSVRNQKWFKDFLKTHPENAKK